MLHLPLRTVDYILSEFEKKLEGYTVQTFNINNFEKVLLIEDSLALYVGKILSDHPVCLNAEEIYAWTKKNEYMDMPKRGADYYYLIIEELTYNTLGFKYNHSKLIREIEAVTKIGHLGLDVSYTKFKGYTRLYWCPRVETLTEKIGTLLPKLKLRERYEAWEGTLFYFIVLEIQDINGNYEYGVAYTNQKPHSNVVTKAHECIKKGLSIGDIRVHRRDFINAFNSWKGKNRQYRLENHFRYFYLCKHLREKDHAWKFADEVLKSAYDNKFTEMERSTYTKPINKWTSEEMVYNITKKLFKQNKVIYQHRPFFLRSAIGGQMSYDVFISGLNVAIEYQGKQHFEPIDFFGGKDSFHKTIERDKLKKELSEAYGIKLIYINHWDIITPELIRERINAVMATGS